jgi:hypothetical protein
MHGRGQPAAFSQQQLDKELFIPFRMAYGFAQEKDPEVAKIFAASQYVFVETIYGPLDTTALDSRVSPEDRRAVFNVEDAVRSWGRYRLTLNRSDAELVFVVRKGRLLAANVGI